MIPVLEEGSGGNNIYKPTEGEWGVSALIGVSPRCYWNTKDGI